VRLLRLPAQLLGRRLAPHAPALAHGQVARQDGDMTTKATKAGPAWEAAWALSEELAALPNSAADLDPIDRYASPIYRALVAAEARAEAALAAKLRTPAAAEAVARAVWVNVVTYPEGQAREHTFDTCAESVRGMALRKAERAIDALLGLARPPAPESEGLALRRARTWIAMKEHYDHCDACLRRGMLACAAGNALREQWQAALEAETP
jgi:hypothetical protein